MAYLHCTQWTAVVWDFVCALSSCDVLAAGYKFQSDSDRYTAAADTAATKVGLTLLWDKELKEKFVSLKNPPYE